MLACPAKSWACFNPPLPNLTSSVRRVCLAACIPRYGIAACATIRPHHMCVAVGDRPPQAILPVVDRRAVLTPPGHVTGRVEQVLGAPVPAAAELSVALPLRPVVEAEAGERRLPEREPAQELERSTIPTASDRQEHLDLSRRERLPIRRLPAQPPQLPARIVSDQVELFRPLPEGVQDRHHLRPRAGGLFAPVEVKGVRQVGAGDVDQLLSAWNTATRANTTSLGPGHGPVASEPRSPPSRTVWPGTGPDSWASWTRVGSSARNRCRHRPGLVDRREHVDRDQDVRLGVGLSGFLPNS